MARKRIQSPGSTDVWGLVARQHGVVARRQLLEHGLSGEAIDHRIRKGRLHPVRRGVYAVGRPVVSGHGRWMAAVLACGPGAVLSHVGAAQLWGVAGSTRLEPGGLEVTVPGHRNPRAEGVVVHRRSLADDDVAVCDRIPVTSPVRTLVDLVARLSVPRLEAAINAADKLDLVDPDTVRQALEGRNGQHGVAALRRVLDRRTFALTESELERRFLPIARRAGLPLPETGVRLNGFKVDFFWRELGLVVETDGLRYHRTPAQQARDRLRDQAHAAAGLTPLRFTHDQVAHESRRVESTLRRVARRLGRGRSSQQRLS
jgi:very-short-patch-repair endonuclease